MKIGVAEWFSCAIPQINVINCGVGELYSGQPYSMYAWVGKS